MDGWMTTSQAAERLGVERHMVCRLIEHGLLPAYRIGLVYLVAEADIEELAAAGTAPSRT